MEKTKGNRLSQRSRLIIIILLVIVCGSASFLLQLRWSPAYYVMGPDSGVFAYTGQRLLSGAQLYRDVWDHKPPGVFWLNALAEGLGGENPWPIWWMGVIWISLTSVIFCLMAMNWLGPLAGSMSSIMFLFTLHHPHYFQGGNLTELYALLPQVLWMAATARFLHTREALWVGLAGTMAGAAFLFKPTTIGLGVAGFLSLGLSSLLGSERKLNHKLLLSYVSFGVTPIILVSILWLLQGGLKELWGAMVLYNLVYSGEGLTWGGMAGTVRRLLFEVPLAPLVWLSLAGLAVFSLRTPFDRRTGAAALNAGDSGSPVRAWWCTPLGIIFLALPVELIIVNLSGRNLGHYFITPLPVFALCAGYLLMWLIQKIRESKSRWSLRLSGTGIVLLLLVWIRGVSVGIFPGWEMINGIGKQDFFHRVSLTPVEEYVIQNTGDGDTVLVWGIHPQVNFLTGRPSPTRYLFSTHIFTTLPWERDRFDVYLMDIQENPPAIILGQPVSSVGLPYFFEGARACPHCSRRERAGLEAMKNYVQDNYELIGNLGVWEVFHRSEMD